MTAKPNILLITADQWRADLPTFAPLPHLDRLAAEGVRFTRHYAQAYPCGPARASLYTGLYPHKHRSVQNGVPLDACHPTLFTEARCAGYRPTLFGYTDITLDPRGRPPEDPDLGEYENVCAGLAVDTLLTERATPWLAHLAARGHRIDAPDRGRAAIFDRAGFGAPAVFAAEESETAFLADRFIAWLAVAGEAPFFAHLSFIAPHPPFAAAAPWHAAVDPAAMPMPICAAEAGAEARHHPFLAAVLEHTALASYVPLPGLARDADEATIRRIRALYAGLACELDHHLGRVFAALRATGRWNDTIIVFTADHGEQLFDHQLLGKTAWFDQSAHIPLIIRDPGGASGHTVDRFTEAVDIMPTLLARIGVAVPRNCDGRSLEPFLAGGDVGEWRDEVHWSFDFRDIRDRTFERALGLPSAQCNLQVVRTEQLKYVHFAGLRPVMFFLARDPDELTDYAMDSDHRMLRLEGLDRLATWRQRHEDETLTGYLSRDGLFTR